MRQFLTRFIRNQRAAVAFIFAACLLPLVMLIGLSIDYSFYVQARSQFGMAADATALYSLREASAIYTVDTKTNGETVTDATQNAENGGETAGQAWFAAQLGTLPTATNNSSSPVVTVASTTTSTSSSSSSSDGCPSTGCASAGFSAAVSYTGSYPPFFNRLFHKSTNWTITGTADATTTFNYMELLVLMDDSGSMLVSADQGITSNTYGTADGNAISATDPGTVGTMDLNTVCIPTADVDSADASYIYSNGLGAYYDTYPSPFITWSNVQNLSNASSVTINSTTGFSTAPQCASGMNEFEPGTTTTTGSGRHKTTTTTYAPLAPCAFACHTASATSYHTLTATSSNPVYTYVNQQLTKETSGTYEYPSDLYGLARQLGVKLKLDTVFQSTETMINVLYNAEQIPGQFTIGMYAFNGDACPIVNGLIDSSYNLPEATTDLGGALTRIEADDYTYNPASSTSVGETSFPPTVTNANGDTNLPFAVSNLIAGTMGKVPNSSSASSGIASCTTTADQTALAQPSTTTTVGSVSNNPQKDIFIITDGVEDSYSPSYSITGDQGECTSREAGEMTGITAEENGTTTIGCDTQAVCQQLKNLGFTVYVLYIPYPNTQNYYYYEHHNDMPADPYLASDANNSSTGISTSTFVTNGTVNVWNNGSGSVTSPDQQALTACASTTAGHSDFYTANSSTDIATQMGQMLSSAMNSAIRITQ